MIKLLFSRQGAYFGFIVEDKVIHGVMGHLRLPYQPPNLKKVESIVRMSRNSVPQWLVSMFKILPDEQKQYDEAKDEEALCEIIIKDAKRENAKLISKQKMEKKK